MPMQVWEVVNEGVEEDVEDNEPSGSLPLQPTMPIIRLCMSRQSKENAPLNDNKTNDDNDKNIENIDEDKEGIKMMAMKTTKRTPKRTEGANKKKAAGCEVIAHRQRRCWWQWQKKKQQLKMTHSVSQQPLQPLLPLPLLQKALPVDGKFNTWHEFGEQGGYKIPKEQWNCLVGWVGEL